MYAIVAAVNLISRFERMRWRRAVERERALQQERVEFSQAVHDTTAQSAYLMGLGIDAARAQAGGRKPGADRHPGGTVPAVPLHHLGPETSHKHGRHLRGPGVG